MRETVVVLERSCGIRARRVQVFMSAAFLSLESASFLDCVSCVADCVNEVIGAGLLFLAARSFREIVTSVGDYPCSAHVPLWACGHAYICACAMSSWDGAGWMALPCLESMQKAVSHRR